MPVRPSHRKRPAGKAPPGPVDIPFPDTLALEKNAAVLNSASPRGLALLSTGVFLTVRENGMSTGPGGAFPAGRFLREGRLFDTKQLRAVFFWAILLIYMQINLWERRKYG